VTRLCTAFISRGAMLSYQCEAVRTYQYDSCCAQLTSVALANIVISCSPLHVCCCNAQEKDKFLFGVEARDAASMTLIEK
jgi:hypothetical protein